MRIGFVWTGFTSYMADCWRALAAREDVSLRIWIDETHARGTDFQPDAVMRGLDYSWCYGEDLSATDLQRVEDEILAFRPDVLFVVGWVRALPPYLTASRRLKDVPMVFCLDMPWRWKLRCFVAPLVLGRRLRRFCAAYVPGEVSARYARWLGFKTVYKGLFAIDTQRFAASAETDEAVGSGGDYFLYIGRNVPEKRLDVLREAHRLYRAAGGHLPLKLVGKGLEDGFARPEEIPALMRGAAAFVLASDFDPWPLVLLEAMSAGCPVIASDRCTNRPELGRDWRVFRHGDARALARLMAEAENGGLFGLDATRLSRLRARHVDATACRVHVSRPPLSASASDLGTFVRQRLEAEAELVRPYDVRVWAERVVDICHKMD